MLFATLADALLLERFTNTPPAAAALARVTVPVEPCPPVTVVGFRFTADNVPVPALAGFTVSADEMEFVDVAVI